MDNELAKIFNKIAEKFGIVVDWSQDNIYPYIQDILQRYRTVSIVQDAVTIVLLTLGAILATLALKYILKQDRKYIIDEDADVFISAVVVAVCIVWLFIFVPVAIANIFDITEWIFAPEIQFVKELSKLIK